MKKRADGRYQRKLLLPSGRTRTVYGRTLAALKRAEDLARDEDRAGLKVGDTTTVARWAAIWLQTYKGDLRPNTVRMYQSTLALHILPQIGTLQVRDLRPLHCQAILRSVADRSESLQRKVRFTLRQMCKAARLNGLMLRDPTEGLTITPQPKSEKMPCLSQADAAALVQAVRQLPDKRAAAFVGLCLYCGLRREEALGVQWGDIKGNRLTVTRAVTHAGGNQPDRSMRLKSDAARRVLPIPTPLAEILTETPRMALWVIPAMRGGPITSSAFRSLWRKVQAVTPVAVHPHMLRHTYATTLYHAGVDLRTAQKLLGHASITMTADVYTHIGEADTIGAIAQIDKYLIGTQAEDG